MRGGSPAPFIAALALAGVLLLLAAPPVLLAYSLGVWGAKRPTVAWTPRPGAWVGLAGGLMLVLILSVVFPPAAWLVLLAAVAYLALSRDLIGRLTSAFGSLRGGG